MSINENTKQIKSRQLVADHGEMFTYPKEVNAMLDLVREYNYSPNILNCLANATSDKVFTSPELANHMLNLLPQSSSLSVKCDFPTLVVKAVSSRHLC